jgi:GT2 family glycosyltransferase
VTVSVVIPTTHSVEYVLQLAHRIEAIGTIGTTITVVDNGPHATERGWEEFDGHLVVRDSYLGSEQAFVLGLRCAPTADWYLLLDHDARLHDDSISTLLGAATDHKAVYSANVGGAGNFWDRPNGETPPPRDLTNQTIAVEFAPWSGLLLCPHAVDIVTSQESGFFFYWDDYFACWNLRRAGIEIWGVPEAIIENEHVETEWMSPWRDYYYVRNHILFYRETGYGSLSELLLVRGKDLCQKLLRLRRYEWTRATFRGLIDGMRDRRGPIMLPS